MPSRDQAGEASEIRSSTWLLKTTSRFAKFMMKSASLPFHFDTNASSPPRDTSIRLWKGWNDSNWAPRCPRTTDFTFRSVPR